MLNRFLVLIALFGLISAASGQTTWYVDDDACPGPGDGSAGDPFCSIQDAIDVAVNSDAIEVAPGTYTESIDFLGKAITVYSIGGPEVTVIDGGGVEPHVVTCTNGEGVASVLDGFTITGGNASGAAPDERGGGIYIQGSSPTLIGCILQDNNAIANGGGMHISNGDPQVINCRFVGNATNSRGGGIYISGSFANMINCAFTGNAAGFQGGAIWNAGSPTFTNCTFSGNSAPSNGGALHTQSGGAPHLANCIVWNNGPNSIVDNSGGLTIAYSNIEDGWVGTGNINADPLFVDPDGPDNIIGTVDDDLRLFELSPSVDAGDNAAVSADVVDLDGDLDTGEAIPFDLDFAPRFVDDAGVTDSGAGTPPIVDMGAYERQVNSPGGEILVPDHFPTIQQAIDAAVNGDEIVVAAGTYGLIDFDGKAITIRSADGPFVTTLDAGGTGTVVTCTSGEGPDSVLQGFTITNGDANSGGGMQINSSSPAVINCIFRGNTAMDGGGMSISDGNPTVINCVFDGNEASFWGGAIFIQGGITTVVNCTFSGNSATVSGGGIRVLSGQAHVTNCILWNNAPDQILNSSGNVQNSLVQGSGGSGAGWSAILGEDGGGNLDTDPLFADSDLRGCRLLGCHHPTVNQPVRNLLLARCHLRGIIALLIYATSTEEACHAVTELVETPPSQP